jgi:hypothetical protein
MDGLRSSAGTNIFSGGQMLNFQNIFLRACDKTRLEIQNRKFLQKYNFVKITVERCDKIKVAVSQIFDRVKSVALWSANIRKLAKNHKGYGSAAS